MDIKMSFSIYDYIDTVVVGLHVHTLKILTEQSLSNISKIVVVGHLSKVERGYRDNIFHELPRLCQGPRVNIHTLSIGVLNS